MYQNDYPLDDPENSPAQSTPASSGMQDRLDQPNNDPIQGSPSYLPERMAPDSEKISTAEQDRSTGELKTDNQKQTGPGNPAKHRITEEAWFNQADADELRSRWNTIQVQFIDSPCSAVEQGDTLVAEVIQRISQIFSEHQNRLYNQWLNHDDISTEELRITLLNYRSLLEHLLKL
jgi:hypothetical protein